jgi:hypothetical protein
VEVGMNKRAVVVAVLLLVAVLLAACGTDERQVNRYEVKVNEAEKLTDEAEKLYHDAVALPLGGQRDSLMRQAYDTAKNAIDILNQLDDEFGNREVPEGQVLAHIPVLSKCTRVISDIVRMMRVGD